MSRSAQKLSPRARILVVEDEALIAEEIQDRLRRLGFEVVGLEDSGEKVLELIESRKPDLVLMDIRLKGALDGIETAEAMRRGNVDVPLVYLTAHADPATLERAKATAPLGYVLKPFQERDLAVTLEMALHRHQLEQRLRDSESRYATTLASIRDGLLATDSQGRVTLMNPLAEALTQWTSEEARGRAAEEVLPLLDEASGRPATHPVVLALSPGGAVRLQRPLLLVARDGSRLPIEESTAPILDSGGRAIGAVVAFRDLRQHRKSEEALRQTREQLRQAQKMEAIGRLAGGIAHDFNNLLTIISGYSELLLGGGNLDPASQSFVEEIRRAVDRSAALTRQLLAFSRQQLLSPQVIHLNSLLTDLTKMLGRLIGEDVRLSQALGPDLMPIEADPGQIEQVIMNLAVNARDAMPRGGSLTIETQNVVMEESVSETRPEMPAGRYVMLAVSDDGEGMTEEVKARLFEPFFTTREPGKGTGLGLATVYGVVKQSGGAIYVYSEPGRGSTFKIYLPACEGSPLAEIATTPSKADLRGDETILLVEDQMDVRTVISMALKRFGYDVLTAASGERALEILAEHPGRIHLLLTDVVMPAMSGPQLAEKVTAAKPEIRVLYLSGYTDDSVLRHGILNREATFIQKPFTAVVLARKVREILDRSG